MLPSRIHSFQGNATGPNSIQITGYALSQLESGQEGESTQNVRLSQCSQKTLRNSSAPSSYPGAYQFIPEEAKWFTGITPRRINGTQDNFSHGCSGRVRRQGTAHRSASKGATQRSVFNTRTRAIPSRRGKTYTPPNLSLDRHDYRRTERRNLGSDMGQSRFAAWSVRLHRSSAGIDQQTANGSTNKIRNHCSFADGKGYGSNALRDRVHGTPDQRYQASIQRGGRKSGYLVGNASHPETLGYIVASRGQYFRRPDIGHDRDTPQYGTSNLPKIHTRLSGKCGHFVGEKLQFYKPVCKTRKIGAPNRASLTAAKWRSIYISEHLRGRSSVGRAPRSQRGGREFNPLRLHQCKTRRL